MPAIVFACGLVLAASFSSGGISLPSFGGVAVYFLSLLGCPALSLDSGIQRARAHRFYFREGLAITTFGFTKSLD